jgi:hypothetical protein
VGGVAGGVVIGGVAVGLETDGCGIADALGDASFLTTWVSIKVLGALPASTHPVSVTGSFALVSFALSAGVCAASPTADDTSRTPKLRYFMELTSGARSAHAAPI